MRGLFTRARAAMAAAVLVAIGGVLGLLFSAALSGGGADRPAGGGSLRNLPGQVKPAVEQRFSPESVKAARSPGESLVATARAHSIRVYRQADTGHRPRRLRSRRVEGKRIALVFLVRERKPGWIRAYLPVRPNLSSGWLRARDVSIAINHFRVGVALKSHRLTIWRGAKRLTRARIGTGKALSPTPTGRYFLTDLLRPPDPKGFYGPYAFGLSAHSPVYTSFAGGDGQVGIHGTDRPEALGRDVSHGCIRVRNAVIARLAKLLPLGTPVDVSRA